LNTTNLVQSDSVSLLWDDTNSADAGYITSTPQVGRLPDGSWKVFSGNGVDSSDGTPSLLVIDAADGAITKVHVGNGDSVPGGLGGVALVKDANSGNVQAIYAGDTAGRLWRFDVSGGTVSVGYDGQPIMTAVDNTSAQTAQPILAAPVVYTHPRGGQVVVFNTGKLINDLDATDTQLQTIYGVWDKQAVGTSTSGLTPPVVDVRSSGSATGNLLQQAIARVTIEQANGSTADFLTLTSADKIDWGSQMGWMLDLAIPNSSSATDTSYTYPKAIYDPQVFGRSVLVGAVTPGNTEESCTATSAMGYAFLLKALTGATSTVPAIDTNGDGLVNDSDQVGVIGFVYPGGKQVVLTRDGSNPGGNSDCLEGSDQYADGSKAIRDCGGSHIKDRVWRQLLNPPHP
jgi:type IV pilus assembly protein PilY1